MSRFVGAIDQGTTSSRFIVFDASGAIVTSAQKEHAQIYPRPGWVEHDPVEIWRNTKEVIGGALAREGLHATDLAAVGITNQRETTVLWDRRSGRPLHNALVWQDTRVADLVAAYARDGGGNRFRAATGLPLATYFSALKLKWLLDQVPDARAKATAGDALFGTIDSWLAWNLTGGPAGGLHVTDVSNASRTQLMNLATCDWDDALLAAFDVPRAVLPRIAASSEIYADAQIAALARVPLAGILGDQQAALAGQTCFSPGEAKNTYGTGCFMLMHTGAAFQTSTNGLITTSAAQPTATPEFALEGSVFIAGAVVQWLRDGLRAIKGSGEVQNLAETVPDSGGVMFVPAFTGLGAPYWNAEARGAIVGLTRGSTVAHIARAALESIAFQSAALLAAMSRDAVAAGGAPVSELRVDGGASVNNLLMQFQADLLGIPVVRPQVIETTALGAAYLAGLACGMYASLDELASQWQVERRFHPTMSRERAAELMGRWEHAVRQATAT